jgi:hypothetical protein
VGGPVPDDLSSYLDDDMLARALDTDRPLELPEQKRHTYRAFVDASGGVKDAFTMGIAHREGERLIIDVLRGRKPKFDPADVVREFSGILRTYRITRVRGDSYAEGWIARAFAEHNIVFEKSSASRSTIYLECLPLFQRGLVNLPEQPDLLRELKLLERKQSRSGRDQIDHPRGSTDDFANAACGVLHLLMSKGIYRYDLSNVDNPEDRRNAPSADVTRLANYAELMGARFR